MLVVRWACLSLSNNNSPTVTRRCMKIPLSMFLPTSYTAIWSRFFTIERCILLKVSLQNYSKVNDRSKEKWKNCAAKNGSIVSRVKNALSKVGVRWSEIKFYAFVFFLSFFSFSAGEKERILSIFSGSSGSTNALRSSRYTGHGSINFNVY